MMTELPPHHPTLVLRPTMALSWQDIRDIWDYRELLWILALRDVRVQYKPASLGNLMSEGMFSMDFVISALDPVIIHVLKRGLFTFSVHDPVEGDSVRGMYAGPVPGAARPMLPWKTESLGTVVNLQGQGKR